MNNLKRPHLFFSKPKKSCDARAAGLKEANLKKMKGVKHLPKGRGPYFVGCTDIMTERDGESKYGSFFRLYYPANCSAEDGNTSWDNMNAALPSSSSCEELDEPSEQSKEMNGKNNEDATNPRWPKWLPKPRYRDGYMHFMRKENSTFYNFLFDKFGGGVYVPALWDAPLLSQECYNQFPVLVFSHGLGGIRTTYSTLCLDLASQGFIVAAVEHRDGSASATYYRNKCEPVTPLSDSVKNDSEDSIQTNIEDSSMDDNQQSKASPCANEKEWKFFERYDTWDNFIIRNAQLKQRTEECMTALDILFKINDGKDLENLEPSQLDLKHFENRLNMKWISVAGHSFGGATVVDTLANDKRFKVGVVLDGWMLPLEDNVYPSVTQPILMINTETFQWKRNILSMKQLDSEHVERIILTIRGTCHQSTTDFQFLFNKFVGRIMKARYTLSPKIAIELTVKAMQGFIWKHFGVSHKEKHEFIMSGQHEMVILGTNVDLND